MSPVIWSARVTLTAKSTVFGQSGDGAQKSPPMIRPSTMLCREIGYAAVRPGRLQCCDRSVGALHPTDAPAWSDGSPR